MLGAGFIVKSHASAVAAIPGLELHVVGDTSISKARAAAATYGFAQAVGSVEELAASDCDVVHILVPPFLHEEAAATMLLAGKSVFLEKPMGLDSRACARLCKLADEMGLALGVNHNFLFSPRYEAIRQSIRAGELGAVNQLIATWHSFLPQLQSGPYDNWMLAAPTNLLFELFPHLIAFVLDLVGAVDIKAVVTGDPFPLPSAVEIFRNWSVIAEGSGVNVILSLSVARGQTDRLLRLRGSGGSAQVDFGRDIAWVEKTKAENPSLEAHGIASSIARQTKHIAGKDRRRRLLAAVRQRPDAAPFDESVFRSIQTFYQGSVKEVDPRHSGRFGTAVMELCERISDAAGTGAVTRSGITAEVPAAVSSPKILVVGGTGFIGRRLVRQLVEQGFGVRVLTRNINGAALEFRDLPVELMQGSHGNPADAAAAVEGVETVYHLAKVDGKRWQDYLDGDVEPTRVLAEAALDQGVKRFVYTGTIDSYSSGDRNVTIDCSTPLDPKIAKRNLYARSKAVSEALLRELHQSRGLPLVTFRPGIVIGAGSPPQHLGIARFINETEVEFWGTGQNRLPLVLVDDVADALVRGHTMPGIEGETFLLTSEPSLSAMDYVQELSVRTGIPIRTRSRSAWRHWLADFAKECVKHAIRHPNRRASTLHDWRCRGHHSRYNSSHTRDRIGWVPTDDPWELLRRGLHSNSESRG
jgi:nucleoside-diphosphate-sugar epimerase/predicted dehydrogenase